MKKTHVNFGGKPIFQATKQQLTDSKMVKYEM